MQGYNHIKTLDEINWEFNKRFQSSGRSNAILPGSAEEAPPSGPQKKRLPAFVPSLIFYLGIILAVAVVFIITGDENKPRDIFGYGYFTVLTKSMQREIPQGSVIITKRVDPKKINVGDDITFFKDNNTTITHRVIEIHRDHQQPGLLGFKTKGIENPNPDKDIVNEQNVIGVVKFTVPKLGGALAFVKNNLLLVGVIFALVLLLSFCLRIFLASPRPAEEHEEDGGKKTRRKAAA